MVENFEFGRPVRGRPPIVAPLIFVKFSLFLIPAYSKSLIHLAPTVQKL